MPSNLLFLQKPTNYDYIRHQRLHTARHRPPTNAEHSKMLGAQGSYGMALIYVQKRSRQSIGQFCIIPARHLEGLVPPLSTGALGGLFTLPRGAIRNAKQRASPTRADWGLCEHRSECKRDWQHGIGYRPKGQEIGRRKGQTAGLDKGGYRVIGFCWIVILGDNCKERA